MDFLGEKIKDARRIIDRAIDEYKPSVILAGFTGGSDSLTLLHLLKEFGFPFFPFFCNTGIGVFEQWEYIRSYCKRLSLTLIEQPVVYRTYKQMVLLNGFPGGAMHNIMYSNLKEKSIIHINNFYHKQAIVLSGVRISESERRKINIKDEIQHIEKVNLTWVSPLMNWDDDDKEEYLEERGIELSPVSKTLGMSGECLCGCYATKGELQKLKDHYPATAKVITDLETLLYDVGFTWGWEDQPPKGKQYNKTMEKIFPGFNELKAGKRDAKKKTNALRFMPMCHKCEFANQIDQQRKAV